MRRTPRVIALLALLLGITVAAIQPAPADPVDQGSAGAFGVTASLAGSQLIPPTPEVSTTLDGADAFENVLEIPVAPLAVSGTINTAAAVHGESDLESALTEKEQGVAGPYNAQSVTAVEDLDVLLDTVAADISLVSAAAVRSEAVGVCNNGQVEYSANSEILDLDVAGSNVPLNDPIEQILGLVEDLLEDTGLADLVSLQTNVVTELDDGIAVDALRLQVLRLLGSGSELVDLRIGHAEVGGLNCGPLPGDTPECSDGIDNDGDGKIDFSDDPNDPDADHGCESPEDDSEGGDPECADGIDNDGDDEIDFVNDNASSEDPDADADDGCTSFKDDDESDPGEGTRGPLPSTGGSTSALMGLGAAGLMAAGLALRRRLSLA